MRAPHTLLMLTALGVVPLAGRAQPLTPVPASNIILSTRFATPLRYESALTRLGTYYQEQVGRILPLTFPEIAPMSHFEVWHDMFVFFEPAAGGMNVTIKRPTEGIGTRLVKTWMLEIAGRLEAQLPLEFQEETTLQKVEADLFASRRDMARAFQQSASMKPIPTWEHAGLIVSAAPLAWIVLAASGSHGVHHVKVETENAEDAKQLMARLALEVQKPGIYSVYSEEEDLAREVHDLAGGQSAEVAATSSQAVYIPNPDLSYIENKLRADPEMMKRTAAAQGQFSIRCRLDKTYRKLTISWTELTGFARASGRYEAERSVGQGMAAAPKPVAPSASPLTLRAKLPPIAPGAYRVRLDGEDEAGNAVRIDERIFWYDGKVFEEL